MKTFEQLVENLIQGAFTDGDSGAEGRSPAVISTRDELLARAARLTGTTRPIDGAEIAVILDGRS